MAERALSPVPASPEQPSSAAFGSPLDPVAAVPPQRLRHPHDTYIVQVQKDQIYRVPPPENAYLAERYRAERRGGGGGGNGSPCSPCALRALAALLAAAALVAAGVALSAAALRPDAPSFSVDRLSVRNASRQQRVDYDFFLTAINPNKVTALWYSGGGAARLSHQGATLAEGDAGEPEEGGEDATDFNLLLHGGRAPRAVEKGLKGSKDVVALDLVVEFAVQVHVGALGLAQKRLAVACEVGAAGLRKDVHISSQSCKSSFGN